LIDAYLRDGQKATDSDPSETVWVQVNVLNEIEFEVDSKEVANATERGYFDVSGRSIDSRLKVGENGIVKLTPETKGQLIVLKEEAAAPHISSGKLELIQRVYVRPLIDYEEAFNQHVVRDHEVGESIALFQRDSAEIEKANQLGQEMISFRQVEEQELKSDLANFQKEVAVLTEVTAEAETALAELKNQLRQKYTNVQEMYRNIQAQHAARTGSGLSSTVTGN
jgi:flagellar motility protein MotE (MotC chaperone)